MANAGTSSMMARLHKITCGLTKNKQIEKKTGILPQIGLAQAYHARIVNNIKNNSVNRAVAAEIPKIEKKKLSTKAKNGRYQVKPSAG